MKSWSALQENIFNAVANGQNHLVIRARAGCGKTSTIIEAAKRLPPDKKILFCAFNKNIADELIRLLPDGCEARTLHSLGLGLIRGKYPDIKIDEYKALDLTRSLLIEQGRTNFKSKKPDSDLVSKITKLVSLIKNTSPKTKQDIFDLCLNFDLADFDHNEILLADLAIEVCKRSCSDITRLDFDDMVFLPSTLKILEPRYDFVFVDEAQDLNQIQLELAISLVGPQGRMIIVGDDRQAIYGFRGAAEAVLDKIGSLLNAEVLPLSITYRCPQEIVTLANSIVSDFHAAADAPKGRIFRVTMDTLNKNVRPGDFILSRLNAPLVSLCLNWLAAKKPAIIAGRDISQMLRSLVWKSKKPTLAEFLIWLDKYRQKQKSKFIAMDTDKHKRFIQILDDKCSCLRALARHAGSLDQLKTLLDTIFADNDSKTKIVLSTVHKAKGLERERVWVLKDTFGLNNSIEEENLWYVAITRAKSDLFIVEPDKTSEKRIRRKKLPQ